MSANEPTTCQDCNEEHDFLIDDLCEDCYDRHIEPYDNFHLED